MTIREAIRWRVFAALSGEWQTVKEIATRAPSTRHDAAIALESLSRSGQIEWRPIRPSMYRKKLKLIR
jgi:hypothetical protein